MCLFTTAPYVRPALGPGPDPAPSERNALRARERTVSEECDDSSASAVSRLEERRRRMAAGFSEWKVNRQYSENERVVHLGKQYRCLVAHKSNSASNPKTTVKTWQAYTG
ncbi:carbohydrate-binding protein [Streptomyces sp. NPDC006341]|uniref:carbohydrate-binding protein n=2 Tax=unclassified Streptomyces TaxID=2593676 RepID=UPI0033AF7575